MVLARRHRSLAESTRREYRRRLERALDAVMALAPTNRHGQRLRKRFGRLREHLFTFLDHPDVTAELIRRTTFTATEQELKQRVEALRDAGWRQRVFPIAPGEEGAIEDWARVARAFAWRRAPS